jgi:drug/metabolite transporter (DMT)-like permease
MIIKESIGITLYQQVLIRGFFQLITNLVPIYYNDSSFEPTLNVSSYIVSAILGGIKFLAIQNGINILNMTEVYTILHLSPIITIILGVIFINEKVTLIDIIQTLLSFTGVILVIKPNFIFNHTHSSKYEDNY